jgi:hypothetical protein
MKQTITIEVANNTVLEILRNLAAMSLIRFTEETIYQGDKITARLNEIYSELDSSIDPFVVAAQAEVIQDNDW